MPTHLLDRNLVVHGDDGTGRACRYFFHRPLRHAGAGLPTLQRPRALPQEQSGLRFFPHVVAPSVWTR